MNQEHANRRCRKRRKPNRLTKNAKDANESEETVTPCVDWVPLQLPDKVDEMIENWVNYPGPKIGWCLLCDRPIKAEHDLITGTDTHDCAEGRRLFEGFRFHVL